MTRVCVCVCVYSVTGSFVQSDFEEAHENGVIMKSKLEGPLMDWGGGLGQVYQFALL